MIDALLIVDPQIDFISGSLKVPRAVEIIPVLNRLITWQKWPVYISQEWHPQSCSGFASNNPGSVVFSEFDTPFGRQIMWPDHCVEWSDGARLHSGLVVNGDWTIVRKGTDPKFHSYSSFAGTGLPDALGRRFPNTKTKTIGMAGLALDKCVMYSAIDAMKLGYNVSIILDGCRALSSESGDDAMKQLLAAALATAAVRCDFTTSVDIMMDGM